VSTSATRLRAPLSARAAAARAYADPQRRPASRPAPLEVVRPRARPARRRPVTLILSGILFSAGLFTVVIGHAELAQGQVRLARIQAQITAADVAHRSEVLEVAKLEDPSRVLQVAEQTLHMLPPGQVHQLAHVPLDVALPSPAIVTAPNRSTAATTAAPAG
jgi:hypothetical protein